MNAQVIPIFGGANPTPQTNAASVQTPATSAPNPFAALADQKNKQAAAPKPVSFPLTPEQVAIRDGFRAGHDMVIAAGAGTGKTSTITMLAEDMYQQDNTSRGVYLAFNKSIASEVGSKLFYGNVSAMTIHSLANKGIRNNPQYAPLMNKLGRDFREIMPLRQRAKAFGAKTQEAFGEHDGPIHPKTNIPLYEITGQTMCREAMEAVKRFCQSDDDVIGPQHVRVTKNIDKKVRDRYRARVAEIATRMWDKDLLNPSGTLPFSHDCYLKLYAMSNPDITEQLGLQGKRAVLFFDEAQDSRPCITQIVMGQRDKMQVVLCGDSSQAIYRFTGCRDAIRGFKQFDGVKSYTLSKTFRFGAPIAMVANQILNRIDGSDVRIVPDLSINSDVRIMDNNMALDFYSLSDVDAVICRSNRLLIETAMGLLGTGAKVYCATDTKMIVDIAADYRELEYGGKAKSPMMKQFRTAAEVDRFVNKQRAANAGIDVDDTEDDVEAEVDEILMSILNAVVSNGAAKVLAAMKNCEDDESAADVVVSTIHKSKGRQWNHVAINWDMSAFGRVTHASSLNDELMLLYVAITRARELVSIPEAMFKTLDVTFPVVSNGAHVAPRMGLGPATIDASFDETAKYVQAITGATAGNQHVLSIIEQVSSGSMAPHELVNTLVFASEKYLRNVPVNRDSRGHILMSFLVSVGISNIQEVMELSDSGIPDELLAAMLSPNPVNLKDKELEIVTQMLNPSE